MKINNLFYIKILLKYLMGGVFFPFLQYFLASELLEYTVQDIQFSVNDR